MCHFIVFPWHYDIWYDTGDKRKFIKTHFKNDSSYKVHIFKFILWILKIMVNQRTKFENGMKMALELNRLKNKISFTIVSTQYTVFRNWWEIFWEVIINLKTIKKVLIDNRVIMLKKNRKV